MLRKSLTVIVLAVGIPAAGTAALSGCSFKPPSTKPPTDGCAESDGPSDDTVNKAVAALPTVTAGSQWSETDAGHTKDCRLFWVQLAPGDAGPASPQQLLFFDHDKPLGSPTPNPKPYTTVMSAGEQTVTVQYQWPVVGDPDCCPTGVGTARYRIGDDGELEAEEPIPNQ